MDKVAVLDFGGQYAHLIGRRVRGADVFSDVVPCETEASRLSGYKGVILSGGPASVYESGAPDCDADIFRMGVPVLGICYGMQLIAHKLGGTVKSGTLKEYGRNRIKPVSENALLEGMEDGDVVWMSHGDLVEGLPPGYKMLATSENGLAAAIGNEESGIYGVQFHPEVTHTPKGQMMIKNFVRGICGCDGGWTMGKYIDHMKTEVRERVGKKTCVSFASGGVDSTVSTALVASAGLPGKVRAVYVDNGLMRKDETALVRESLDKAGVDLHVVDASAEFLGMLGGVEDPEVKRRLIGDKFAEIAERCMTEMDLGADALLVQGTLYTDTIESGHGVGKKAANIKTHHNVGSPKIMAMRAAGRVVEPNRLIYKDEVREVGRMLGLPEGIVNRHPFPGPGLAVRVICASEPYYAEKFGNDSDTVAGIAHDSGFEGCIYPIRTVGVQGDGRTYRNLAVLWGRPDWGKMREATAKIVTGTSSVNRVAYLVRGKAPTKGAGFAGLHLDEASLGLLREADAYANDQLAHYNLMGTIQQMPVILFPGEVRPYVAIRDVVTDDFMTTRPAEKPGEMPWECVHDMAMGIGSLDVDGFLIDITDKPPATVEWE